MSKYYYAGPERNPLGPYSAEELRKLADEGKISDDTFVISEGQPNWGRFADWKAAQETSAGDFPPLPPDHARTPDPFASPKTPSPSTSTRVCEWCATSIPEEALKCPHCTKWRKEFTEDRKKFFINGWVSFLCLLCSVFTFVGVWHASSEDEISVAFGNNEQGVWHEKVVTKREPFDIRGMRVPQPDQVSYEFSVSKFLSSFEGWVVIACVIAGMWCGILGCRDRNRLEQKYGSRWRL